MIKFNPGRIVVTRGVDNEMNDNATFARHVRLSLERHLAGDWGNLCDEDRATNKLALLEGDRLFSAYTKVGVPPIWIITEWDRSVTTILFPDEY